MPDVKDAAATAHIHIQRTTASFTDGGLERTGGLHAWAAINIDMPLVSDERSVPKFRINKTLNLRPMIKSLKSVIDTEYTPMDCCCGVCNEVPPSHDSELQHYVQVYNLN